MNAATGTNSLRNWAGFVLPFFYTFTEQWSGPEIDCILTAFHNHLDWWVIAWKVIRANDSAATDSLNFMIGTLSTRSKAGAKVPLTAIWYYR